MVSPRQAAPRIRTLVVDDEPLARSNLIILLSRDPEIELVGQGNSGLEALTLIRSAKPELVFLDVQMPECDGFDVVEMLGQPLPPAIIFVTAYDQYALRAFDAGALDYLLKPFDDDRFAQALARAKERIGQIRKHPGIADRLIIKSIGQVEFVKIPDIDWIEAENYYACLHVGNKTHLLRRRMADLERELDHNRFCRIHRSSIVNLDRVRRLQINAEGEYEVLLDNNTKLRLSRSYLKQLQSHLGIRTAHRP